MTPVGSFDLSGHAAVSHYVDRAARRLGVPDDEAAVLGSSYREIQVEIPIRLSDGGVRVYTGYRVQHKGVLGPFKGGLRFHPSVSLDEMRALASIMTWKTAIAAIPFGGAKGGVDCPADELNEAELEQISRSFIDRIELVLGPTRDIPAPDVNTNAQTMAWMMDQWGKLHGYTPAIVTGKPISLQGSYGREAATGRGVVYVFREVAAELEMSPQDSRIVIQGFGKVGSWAARILHEQGATIVGVSDVNGAIHCKDGIDPGALLGHLAEGGEISDFPGAETLPRDELLEVECDVLIPAAMEAVIHRGNADKLNCRVLIEGANGPTTPEADEILTDRGVCVVPDVVANSGGVAVSYFEWVQNLQHFRWDEREVNERLGGIMRRAYRTVAARSAESGLSLRDAAYELAVERVLTAATTRGYIPQASAPETIAHAAAA